MNQKPRNKSIYTEQGRAEIFYQTINLDHYLTRYLDDLDKPDDKRFHRLTFSEITKLLSQPDTLIQRYTDSQYRHFAISYLDGRYYYTVFYLEKRDDCAKLFAVIVTCYATNNKDIYERWNQYKQYLNARFSR